MMKLEFRQRHLSITHFPAIEVPPLTVVLGINGSGKTHLLQAINNGSIRNSVFDTDHIDSNHSFRLQRLSPVRLIFYSPDRAINFNDESGGNSTSQNYKSPLLEQPRGPIEDFERSRRDFLSQFIPRLEAIIGEPHSKLLSADEDIWALGARQLATRLGQPELLEKINQTLLQASESFLAYIYSRIDKPFPDTGQVSALCLYPAVARGLNIPLLQVTKEHIDQYRPFLADQFDLEIPKLFGRYRDRLVQNNLKRLSDYDNGTKYALSPEDFQSAYGRPPWELISETLISFGLPYYAVSPSITDFTPVVFTMMKINTQEPVSPANLSSGERILLQFALSTYSYDKDFVEISRPKVLLLDELDAPLHPEMVHRWLHAVSQGLVEKQGIQCILTTHSPITVALAPEEALFEIRDGTSGLVKISKQDALNKLTFGVPTLSINFSGRRQVFTESDTDAAIYEKIYSLIKSKISCDRELNFLSTGMRSKNGSEINSGCTIVQKLVQTLTDAGSNSVYGIVDWDGQTVSTHRVKVIAEGARNGIENVLLDPLLICLLLMKNGKAPAELDDIRSFVSAGGATTDNLQRMADAVQHTVFPSPQGERVKVYYLGNATTMALAEYLVMDDHELEQKLGEVFPFLKKWISGGHGKLVNAVVDEVITEYPTFCPVELKTVFESIANATN